jgi:hypothetical protein
MTPIPDTEKFWGSDTFISYAFPLNADGSLQAPDTSPYEGLEIDGTRNFNLTPAQGSTVVNIGNGRLRGSIYRAPREASTAEFTIGFKQPKLKAALQGSNTYIVGGGRFNGRLTNRQGSEPNVALLVVQKGKNDNGDDRYAAYFLPKTRAIPRDSPMTENALEETFQITPDVSKKQIWGKSFTIQEHGFTSLTYEDAIFENCPKIVAWMADGVEDTFLLPDDFPAVSPEEKMAVFHFDSGVHYNTGIVKDVDQIQFDYTVSGLLVAVYEFQP